MHTLAGDVNDVVLFIMLMAFGLINVSEHPPALMTTNFGEKVPVVVYVCEGFAFVDVVPSPKLHR
jgi:hypothetical protein